MGSEMCIRDSKEIEQREQFRLATMAHLQQHLTVQVDGKTIAPSAIQAAPTARHHVDLVITLKFDLSTTGEDEPDESNQARSLSVHDLAFENHAGNVRYSLKPKGNAILTRSNVAPILVRAKRISMDSMDAQQRQESCQIVAGFTFIESP